MPFHKDNALILSRIIAYANIGFGGAVFLMWLFFPESRRIAASLLKADVSLCVLLGGISLLLVLSRPAPRTLADILGRGLGSCVALVGLFTIWQYIFNWIPGMGEILAPDGADASPVHPHTGRMSLNSAIVFSSLGPSLASMSGGTPYRRLLNPSFIFLVPVFATLALSILGILYDIPPLYRFSDFTRISSLTLLATLSLTIGVIAARPDEPPLSVLAGSGPGSYMARRLLVTTLIVPPILGWIIIRGHNLGYYDASFEAALLVLSILSFASISIWFNAVELNKLDEKLHSQLKERERYFRELVDHSPAIFWLTDPLGNCTYRSRRWYSYTGAPPGSGLGLAWMDSVHPEDRDAAAATFEQAKSKRESVSLDYRLKRQDGVFRWVEDIGSPRIDEKGSFLGYIGTVFDVHERKLAEKSMEEEVKNRDDFLSVASHELKTPITSIKLRIQMLQRDLAREMDPSRTASRFKQTVETTMRQVERLGHLVDDLLDVSRIRTGHLDFSFDQTDISRLITASIDHFRVQAAATGTRFEVNVARGSMAYWDGSRIEQVMTNLISNSIKHAPGAPIRISVQEQEDHFLLVFEDSGPGIPPDRQKHIFDRFERATLDRGITGLGLGLFIVKEIIQGHGGSIRLDSSPRNGTRFTIDLPKDARNRRAAV